MIRDFNNPKHPSRVLLTSMKLASQGLNLQTCCSHVIVAEHLSSINMLIQAVSRVSRHGQRREQNVYLVAMDGSFDDWQYTKAVEKYIGQLFTFNPNLLPADAPKQTRSLVGHEIMRKKLGRSYSFFGQDRIDAKGRVEMAQFSATLAPSIFSRLIEDPEARRQLEVDYLRALDYRQAAARDVNRACKAQRSGGDTWINLTPYSFDKPEEPFELEEMSLTANILPIQKTDFQLLRGDAGKMYDWDLSFLDCSDIQKSLYPSSIGWTPFGGPGHPNDNDTLTIISPSLGPLIET
jgi:hypothetical protein